MNTHNLCKCGYCKYLYNNPEAARECEGFHLRDGYYRDLWTGKKIKVVARKRKLTAEEDCPAHDGVIISLGLMTYDSLMIYLNELLTGYEMYEGMEDDDKETVDKLRRLIEVVKTNTWYKNPKATALDLQGETLN